MVQLTCYLLVSRRSMKSAIQGMSGLVMQSALQCTNEVVMKFATQCMNAVLLKSSSLFCLRKNIDNKYMQY